MADKVERSVAVKGEMCASRIRLELVRPGPGSGGADGQMARQSTAQLEEKEQKGRRFVGSRHRRAMLVALFLADRWWRWHSNDRQAGTGSQT